MILEQQFSNITPSFADTADSSVKGMIGDAAPGFRSSHEQALVECIGNDVVKLIRSSYDDQLAAGIMVQGKIQIDTTHEIPKLTLEIEG